MKRILFVCTGNTCRSFFAEYLTKALVSSAVERDEINRGDIKISSAGLFAVEDDDPSEYAVEVLTNVYEIEDADRHKARQVSSEIIEESDLIITMTDGHRHAITSAYPEVEGNIFTLKELAFGAAGDEGSYDIEDPYRGDIEDYTECAAEINDALIKAFPKILSIIESSDD